MSPFWTDELVGEMKRLLKDGLSCTQVGARIGCSRNAIIGKVHRIECATKEKWFRRLGTSTGQRKRVLDGAAPRKRPKPRLSVAPAARQVEQPKQPKQPQQPSRRAPALPAGIVVVGTKPAKLGQPCGILQASGCRWAIGHDPNVIGGHVFCNEATPDGHSYCEAHARANIAPHSRDLIRRTIKAVLPMPRGARGYV